MSETNEQAQVPVVPPKADGGVTLGGVLRAGYKTSEFALNAVTVLAGVVVASGAIDVAPPWLRVTCLAIAALNAQAYQQKRNQVKAQAGV